jgi:enolase
MSLITNVDAYMVLDSRGYPTVAVDIVLDNTHLGK